MGLRRQNGKQRPEKVCEGWDDCRSVIWYSEILSQMELDKCNQKVTNEPELKNLEFGKILFYTVTIKRHIPKYL